MRLVRFMRWFNTEFRPWSNQNYQADYTNNNETILITRVKASDDFMLGLVIIDILSKARDLGLSSYLEVKDNKPVISIT